MSTAAGYPEPGDLLGPFRIGPRLGLGGMGVVFEAVDTHLGRSVALKIISPQLAENPEFRVRFTHEAQAQASLDSPHVVQVYSFGEAGGRLYIASQLIPDGDLGHRLHREGPPPPAVALDLLVQVADGLCDAHAAGLVHRDIKPANVLLRERDGALVAYLADFGIARQVSAGSGLTRTGSAVGTPGYMAPELHTGGRAGTASDVYALGCLLWAALSGSAPYAASSDYLVVKGHLEAPVPQVADDGPLAVELNRVLRTAMAKQPHERHPSATALRDDLRGVLARADADTSLTAAGSAAPLDTRVTAYGPPPGPSRPSRSTRRRSRWVGGLAVAVAVAVVVALVAGLGQRGGGGGTGGGAGAGGGASPDDRQVRAEAALASGYATVFASQGMDGPTSTCVATHLVDAVGLDRLIQAGILTGDLAFVPQVPIKSQPDVSSAFQDSLDACGSDVVFG